MKSNIFSTLRILMQQALTKLCSVRRTVPKGFHFQKAPPATLLKKDFGTGVFL